MTKFYHYEWSGGLDKGTVCSDEWLQWQININTQAVTLTDNGSLVVITTTQQAKSCPNLFLFPHLKTRKRTLQHPWWVSQRQELDSLASSFLSLGFCSCPPGSLPFVDRDSRV